MTKQFITVTQLGPFFVGERPEDLQITFEDADGNAIDLTGYTPEFAVEAVDVEVSTGIGNGTSSLVALGATGITKYAWHADDTAVEGLYRGQMWVMSGSTRLSSQMYEWHVVRGTSPNL